MDDYVGALAASNNGNIANCSSAGTINGRSYVGGLVGHNMEGNITTSHNSGRVKGYGTVGGLVGYNLTNSSITMSHNSGTVTASGVVGGLVGVSEGGTAIIASYNTGTVSGDRTVGGLVAKNHEAGTVMMSYNTGTVTGGDYVGGLVGWNSEGSIFTSYSSGTVHGTGWEYGFGGIGGLVGHNGLRGSITASNSTGNVGGDWKVGGLVGSNEGTIAMGYSTGVVTGDQDVGGLAGWSYGSITASFWDTETSAQATSAGGIGLTTGEMQDPNSFLSAGWDFVGERGNGTCDYWRMAEGDYPRLPRDGGEDPIVPEGSGTIGEPYLVRDGEDLGTMWFRPTAHYRLETSVDLSGVTWPMAVVPWFDGTFDGNGNVISGLDIKGGGELGLFGQLGPCAQISNLDLEAIDVNGVGDYIGGLAGRSYGCVSNCSTVGAVIGDEYVGGIVGWDYPSDKIIGSHSGGTVKGSMWVGGLVGSGSGSITGSYSTSDVCGHYHVGGLVGSYFIGSIEEVSGGITTSYSKGAVSGVDRVGGLVGRSHVNIGASFSSGTVSAENYVGGLVGENMGGNIRTSYSTSVVIGGEFVGGLAGYTESSDIYSNRITGCYSAGALSGDNYVGGLVGYSHDGRTIFRANFIDVEASGLGGGGTDGKTTAQMQTEGTFLDAGWDFVGETANGNDDIWTICEGTNYPRFAWQIPPGDLVCPDGVTMADFSVLAHRWLDENCDATNGYCDGADIDLSGSVDGDDLAAFAESWLDGIGRIGQ